MKGSVQVKPLTSSTSRRKCVGLSYPWLLFLLLPFASPFSSSPAVYASLQPSSIKSATQHHAPPKTLSTSSLRSLPRTEQKQISLRRVLFGTGNEDWWKGGESTCGLWSRLLFKYVSPLMKIASERNLDQSDSFTVDSSRKMDAVVPRLEDVYSKVKSKSSSRASPSSLLAKSLFLHQRSTLLFTACLRLLNTSIQAFPALLVARLLRTMEAGKTVPVSQAVKAAASLIVLLSVKMIVENQYFHNVVKYATLVRGSLAGMIFDKSLRLPGGGAGASTASPNGINSNGDIDVSKLGAGGVLNLMQSDASILESAAMQLHTIWDGPLQIAIYTTLLFKYLGKSVLYGMAVLLMTIPVNSMTLRVLNRMSRHENEAKDARTKRTTEAIANMKLLKLQAWESYFANDIAQSRQTELDRHVSRGVVRALNQAISNAVPSLVLVVTLTAYARTGLPIVASSIFTAISLFNQLRFPLFFYPMLIDSLANGKNALRRISNYLSAEEVTDYVEMLPPPPSGGGAIAMKNGNFLWSSPTKETDDSTSTSTDSAAPALCDVNVNIKPGEVVAVVGSVGSGKTALLKGLLGELVPVPKTVVDPNTKGDAAVVDQRASVQATGHIGYASQEAWLPKGRLRDAVVFGRPYDEERYRMALRDAGLDQDVVDTGAGVSSKADASRGVLSHDTDVGEGGSSLSGGQRARVALARALYGDGETKVFLLDDPLAALDASVGSNVFECLSKRLRAEKAATVLVTNDPSLPRRCDRVILMGKRQGSTCSTILDVGTYDELVARGYDVASICKPGDEECEKQIGMEPLPELKKESTTKKDPAIRVVGAYEKPTNCSSGHSRHADPDGIECIKDMPDYLGDHVVPVADVPTDDIHSFSNGTSIEFVEATQETMESSDEAVISPKGVGLDREKAKPKSADDLMTTGAVPLTTYISYLKAVRKPALIAAMLISFLMSNGAQFYQQSVVAKWTEAGRGGALAAALGGKYLRRLAETAGVVSVFMWLRSFFTMQVGVQASDFFHRRMLQSVFAAPMAFFDATPSGQLLSRFGKELETVDRSLPDGIGSVLFCFLAIASSAVALAGVITPVMLIPIGLIGLLYAKTMGRFRPAARDMKRSESKSRAPIYTHFGEALRGTEVIRSIPGAMSSWSAQHRELTDDNLSVFYAVKALDRWLSIRLETLGNVIVFASAMASIVLTRAGTLLSGSAGWGITQALSITGLLTWAVRCLTDLETNMMSVMRVQELTDIESEPASSMRSSTESGKPEGEMPREHKGAGEALMALYASPSSTNVSLTPLSDQALVESGWPWNGDIQFEKVSMRYNPVSKLVLDNVSISVPRGSSLGVVGRTGSGKSSLLLTLFRLVEIEEGGSITIDGTDIRSVSLQTLREALAIIPQDPVLFEGTLFHNLDATGSASRQDAWSALEAASPDLAREFNDTDLGLDSYVAEGGRNLSAGQRQLICLARALLRRSKILVMDEATSSVDSQTDAQVQETIKREFVNKGVTVITVAHRLDTVLGYDKIAVLGAGELVEYGSPQELLKIPNGELKRLVDADRRNKQKGQAASRKEQIVMQ